MHRTIRVVGNGAMFDGHPSVPVLPPPLLGEHDEELLNGGGSAGDQVDSAAAT
jgi:hypothetical protein